MLDTSARHPRVVAMFRAALVIGGERERSRWTGNHQGLPRGIVSIVPMPSLEYCQSTSLRVK
jgi:hypothetical protein